MRLIFCLIDKYSCIKLLWAIKDVDELHYTSFVSHWSDALLMSEIDRVEDTIIHLWWCFFMIYWKTLGHYRGVKNELDAFLWPELWDKLCRNECEFLLLLFFLSQINGKCCSEFNKGKKPGAAAETLPCFYPSWWIITSPSIIYEGADHIVSLNGYTFM